MNAKPLLADIMPAMVKHAGVWEGVYRHVDLDNNAIENHRSRVECIFPTEGPFGYIQKNLFQWDDGREYRSVLNGELRENKLWWDNDSFDGCSWETDFGLILLNLNRKDDPGANFYEIICMGDSGNYRSRTWQWFKDGKLFKRTLCDEQRVE